MRTRLLRRLALATATLAFTLAPTLPALAAGFAPANRPVYTYTGTGTRGANHVVFNSFINTPNVGDERGFLSAKDAANTAAGGFVDSFPVTDGREVLVRAYVHNDVDASLNAGGQGIARNTRLKISLPAAAQANQTITANLSADNADNGVTDANGSRNTVTDTVALVGTGAFSTTYVPGSARAITAALPAGIPLSDGVATTGALIGTTGADGNIPGGFDNVVLVTFKVAVKAAMLTFTKQVTSPGSTNWSASLAAKPGDTASWLLTYGNATASVVQQLTVKDTLPAHLQLVSGSVTRFDSLHPNGEVLPDGALFSRAGFDTGAMGANSSGYLRYRTVVLDDFASSICSADVQTPATAQATGTGAVTSEAVVTVTRTCESPVAASPSPTPLAIVKVTPVSTPTVTPAPAGPLLPDTGAGDMLAAAAGMSSLGFAGRAYVRSRRGLLDSLKR